MLQGKPWDMRCIEGKEVKHLSFALFYKSASVMSEANLTLYCIDQV